jgi:hypothetical protein
VKVPKTRAKTTTILGAISSYGIVNISVRRPKAALTSKKGKWQVVIKLLRTAKVALLRDTTLTSLLALWM